MILRVAYLYLVNDCVVLVITGLFTFVFCAVLKASYPDPFVFLVANDNPWPVYSCPSSKATLILVPKPTVLTQCVTIVLLAYSAKKQP